MSAHGKLGLKRVLEKVHHLCHSELCAPHLHNHSHPVSEATSAHYSAVLVILNLMHTLLCDRKQLGQP